jgi:hypothetical protein
MPDLNLKTSCGTPVTLPYELPDSVRFDCFVPGVGICETTLDARSEEVDVVDMRGPDGVQYGVHGATEAEAAVLEQAGDVCAVFERALSRKTLMSDYRSPDETPDPMVLTAIADMAMHETELRAAWERLPGAIRSRQHTMNERPLVTGARDMTPSKAALRDFIEYVLLERAQAMATAAAKRRQAQWNEEQTEAHKEAYAGAVIDLAIKRAKEEGP